MKRFITCFIMIYTVSYLSADCKTGGASYFYPQSEILRDIYGGGVNYHFSFSQKICRHLDLWAGADYFNKDGHSLRTHQRTNIKIIPVDLGLKYFFPIHFKNVNIDFYINSALKYYFLRIYNHSSFVIKHSNKNGLGGVLGSGCNIRFPKHILLNFFIDYSDKEFHHFHHEPYTKSHRVNIGGWDFGGGIGLKF